MSTPQILAAALLAVSVVVNVLIFWSNAAPRRRPRPSAAMSIAILTGWTVLLTWGGFFNE